MHTNIYRPDIWTSESLWFQIVSQESEHGKGNVSSWTKLTGFLHQILEELLEPPTVAAVSFLDISPTFFLLRTKHLSLWSSKYRMVNKLNCVHLPSDFGIHLWSNYIFEKPDNWFRSPSKSDPRLHQITWV